MTYNFDPDSWYERERLKLEADHRDGRLSEAELASALAALERRHERLLGLLDRPFELPRP